MINLVDLKKSQIFLKVHPLEKILDLPLLSSKQISVRRHSKSCIPGISDILNQGRI